MFTKASELIDEASSLADLQNTQFISYADKTRLINEAYRDIVARYYAKSDDYWMLEEIIALDQSMQVPSTNPYTYLVPLPDDFYQLRLVSISFNGTWFPVNKFPVSSRDLYGSYPGYRMQNGKLWIMTGTSIPNVKVSYYPKPQTLTFPNDPISFAESLAEYNLPLITSMFYIDRAQTLLYIYDHSIIAQSLDSGESVTLFTSVNAIANIWYFQGTLYWLDTVTGLVQSSTTDLATPILSPAAIANSTGCLRFTIQAGNLYYSDGANTYKIVISSLTKTTVLAADTTSYQLLGTIPVWIQGNLLYYNGVATAIPGKFLAQDRTDIYIHGVSDETVTRVSIVNGVPTAGDIVATGVVRMGLDIDASYLPLRTDSAVLCQSVTPDSDISYPHNEANELMSYSVAIGMVRKNSDDKKMTLLKARIDEIWDRFTFILAQDQYQFEQINDVTTTQMGWWFY